VRKANPLVAWNDTDKLISNVYVDNENAIPVLYEESSENDGYLYIDDQPHYISGEPTFLGDVDSDGEVTAVDAAWIRRTLADIPIPIEIIELVADVDEDNDVTIMDATWIQRWLADMPSCDNIGKPI